MLKSLVITPLLVFLDGVVVCYLRLLQRRFLLNEGGRIRYRLLFLLQRLCQVVLFLAQIRLQSRLLCGIILHKILQSSYILLDLQLLPQLFYYVIFPLHTGPAESFKLLPSEIQIVVCHQSIESIVYFLMLLK